MGYLSISCGSGKSPVVKMYEIDDNYYISITPLTSNYPEITFFVDSPQELETFKDNVAQAYQKFLEEESD